MNWRLAAWRAIMKSPLSISAAMIFVIVSAVGGAYLVMRHGYRLTVEWKEHGKFDLVPPAKLP